MELNVSEKPIVDITIGVASPNINISLVPINSHDIPKYDGEYEFTPTVDGGKLRTANKLMEQDVNIKAIPFYKVSNAFNGETIFIAKEL